MTRSKISKPAGTMIDRFTYSPGDGHRYRWQAGRDVITVERITGRTPRLTFTATGDTIPAPATATLTAMAAAVDEWRGGRP